MQRTSFVLTFAVVRICPLAKDFTQAKVHCANFALGGSVSFRAADSSCCTTVVVLLLLCVAVVVGSGGKCVVDNMRLFALAFLPRPPPPQTLL